MTTEAKWSDFASLDGARTLAAANKLLPAWVSLLLVIVIGILWFTITGDDLFRHLLRPGLDG